MHVQIEVEEDGTVEESGTLQKPKKPGQMRDRCAPIPLYGPTLPAAVSRE